MCKIIIWSSHIVGVLCRRSTCFLMMKKHKRYLLSFLSTEGNIGISMHSGLKSTTIMKNISSIVCISSLTDYHQLPSWRKHQCWWWEHPPPSIPGNSQSSAGKSSLTDKCSFPAWLNTTTVTTAWYTCAWCICLPHSTSWSCLRWKWNHRQALWHCLESLASRRRTIIYFSLMKRYMVEFMV